MGASQSRGPGNALAPLMAAIQFLTVVPVPGPHAADAKTFARSIAYFPLVGLLLGALVALADLALRPLLAPQVTDALVIALLAVLTGALHLDGLADTCDGLFAPGRSVAERLAIMRDSRIGSFGVVGLVLLLLLKFSALGALSGLERSAALLAAPVLGRWGIVYAYATQPYARPEPSLSAALKQGASPFALVFATVWAVMASLSLGLAGLLVFLSVALATWLLVGTIAARLGGITGDTCGAVCEAAETLVLVSVFGVRSSVVGFG